MLPTVDCRRMLVRLPLFICVVLFARLPGRQCPPTPPYLYIAPRISPLPPAPALPRCSNQIRFPCCGSYILLTLTHLAFLPSFHTCNVLLRSTAPPSPPSPPSSSAPMVCMPLKIPHSHLLPPTCPPSHIRLLAKTLHNLFHDVDVVRARYPATTSNDLRERFFFLSLCSAVQLRQDGWEGTRRLGARRAGDAMRGREGAER